MAPREALRLVLVAAAFAYPATLTTLDRIPGWVLGVALAASLFAIPAFLRQPEARFAREEAPAFAALLAFLLVALGFGLARHAPQWYQVNYFRLLGLAFVVMAIRVAQPSPTAFFRGCAVGALGAAAVATWQTLALGLARAEGPAGSFGEPLTNIFAGLAVVAGFVGCAGLMEGSRRDQGLAAAGLAAGIVAAVLSGSRGAWVAFVVLGAWLFGRRKPWMAAALVATFFVASLSFDVLQQRWSAGLADLTQYLGGHADTSLGTRFELWKAALAAFASHPLAGVGPERFSAWLAQRVAAGESPAFVMQFGHAHSDLLHALATGGIVQFVALLAAFVLPWRRFRSSAPSPATRAGEAAVLGFVVLGLADCFFVHRVALTAYVVFAAWLLAWLPREAAR